MDPSSAAIALGGGALMGIAGAILLLFDGRLAGVGGIVAGLLQRSRADVGWRAAFVAGLFAGGFVFAWLRPAVFGSPPASLPLMAVAGVVVGFGTRLGGGCTSGHGICGISRLSKRALVATLTFMLTGALVVGAVRILGGAS